MICESANSKEFVFRPELHEESWKSFIFDFNVIPLLPSPKRVIFKSRLDRKNVFVMSWRKFGQQTVFRSRNKKENDVVLIEKAGMKLERLP